MALEDVILNFRAEIEELRQGVSEVKEDLQGLQTEATESMEELEEGAEGAASGMDSASSSSGGLSNGLKKLAVAVSAALIIRKLANFAKEAALAFDKQQVATRQLEAALKANGKEVESTLDRYLEFASGIQEVTTVGDETTIQLLQLAETLQSVDSENAVKGAIGLAEALGGQSEAMLRAIVLAEQGEFTMLQRYIPAIRSATTDAEKMAIVQEAMANGFDLAKTRAQEGLGPLQQLQNAYGDLQERFGAIVVELLNQFLPTLQKTVDALEGIFDSIEEGGKNFGKFEQTFQDFLNLIDATVEPLNAVLRLIDSLSGNSDKASTALSGLSGAFRVLTSAVQFFSIILTVPIKALNSLVNLFKALKEDGIKGLGDALATEAKILANEIVKPFETLSGRQIIDLSTIGDDAAEGLNESKKSFSIAGKNLQNAFVDGLVLDPESEEELNKVGEEMGGAISKGIKDGLVIDLSEGDLVEEFQPDIDFEIIPEDALTDLELFNQDVRDEMDALFSDLSDAQERLNEVLFSSLTQAAEIRQQTLRDAADGFLQVFGAINSLVQQSFDNQIATLREQRDEELEAAGDNANERIAIEKKFAREEAEIKRKQAIQDRIFRIANIAFALAETIFKVRANAAAIPPIIPPGIPNPAKIAAEAQAAVQIALATTLSALQTGLILSQKLPGFKGGGFTGHGGASDVAGVTHKGEFVVDAPTTSALNLTGKTMQQGRDILLGGISEQRAITSGLIGDKNLGDKEAREYRKNIALLAKGMFDDSVMVSELRNNRKQSTQDANNIVGKLTRNLTVKERYVSVDSR